ncbi:MAG: universal stress protein [Gemmatimonadota bacterium]|nr:MAG: universal stress protein [Gemmatimonadota bacterium]
MYGLKTVLAATDGSKHGGNAVLTGAALALRAGARFEVLRSGNKPALPDILDTMLDDAPEFQYESIERARKNGGAETCGVDVSCARVHVVSHPVAPPFIWRAGAPTSDLLVVGVHPRRVRDRLSVGSSAKRVIHRTQCPVMIVKRRQQDPFLRILAAVDLSQDTQSVLGAAAAVAQVDRGELRVLHVAAPPRQIVREAAVIRVQAPRRPAHGRLEQLLGEAMLPSEVAVDSRVREGHAGHEILREAKEWNANLIVVGTNGLGFFNRALPYSTPLFVLRHSSRTTMVVP